MKVTPRFHLLALPVLFVLARPELAAAANTYYVDAARSDDSGNGLSWATAKKTVQAGMNLMTTPGDELRIKTGTYTGAMSKFNVSGTSWNTGAFFSIRSDDGNGNYDRTGVIIKGDSAESPWGTAAVVFEDCSYWRLQQLTIRGDSALGNEFALLAESSSVAQSGPSRKGIWLDSVTVDGNPSQQAIQTISMDDVRVTNSRINCTGCQAGDGSMINFEQDTSSLAPYFDGLTFQRNDVSGRFNAEYGLLVVKRGKNLDISRNWFHDMQSHETITIRHGGPGVTDIYNNVIELGGAIWNPHPNSYAFQVILFRGMTACSSTNCGLPGTRDGRVYNNTVDVRGSTNSLDFFVTNNDTIRAVVQNNLIIGSIRSFISSRDTHVSTGCSLPSCSYGSGTDGLNRASHNTIRNNVATGTVTSTEANGGGGLPSQHGWTISNNLSGQGTAFLSLVGAKPSPFFHLTASNDGTNMAPVPPTDYDGVSRSSTPAVGAFEFGGSTAPPDAPANLTVQ